MGVTLTYDVQRPGKTDNELSVITGKAEITYEATGVTFTPVYAKYKSLSIWHLAVEPAYETTGTTLYNFYLNRITNRLQALATNFYTSSITEAPAGVTLTTYFQATGGK